MTKLHNETARQAANAKAANSLGEIPEIEQTAALRLLAPFQVSILGSGLKILGELMPPKIADVATAK